MGLACNLENQRAKLRLGTPSSVASTLGHLRALVDLFSDMANTPAELMLWGAEAGLVTYDEASDPLWLGLLGGEVL